MKNIIKCILLFSLLTNSDVLLAAGNDSIESLSHAKKLLTEIYSDHRETLYCRATYDKNNAITLPDGFTTNQHRKRASRMEWEHVVPAENFGRSFTEWREGHPICINRGKPFKGRRCAEKANREFRRMQSDLYNLFPSIGAVNAARANFNFQILPDAKVDFGTCPIKIQGRKVEPPSYARGVIARTYLYMEDSYKSRFRMSKQQKQLMDSWNKLYPPDKWECERAIRIERIQKNQNKFTKILCKYKIPSPVSVGLFSDAFGTGLVLGR